MRKKTSQMLKRAFLLLTILTVFAYLFIPKIILNFMGEKSVTVGVSISGVEKLDDSSELEGEVESFERINNENIQATGTEAQDTIYIEQDSVDIDINKKDEMQSDDSNLEETPSINNEKDALRRDEDAAREEERHKRMQPSIEKFIEKIKTPDWYK